MEQDQTIPSILDNSLGFNLDRVSNIFRLELMRALAAHEVTPEQWQVMALLWHSPQPLTQQNITQLLSKDKHNVSRMVARLEAKGWLERVPDPHSRAVFLRSTNLADRLRDELPQALYAHFDRLDLGLNPAQIEQLTALLKIVRAHQHQRQSEEPDLIEVA